MASASLSQELDCSVCLSVYRDPVMLPCGHNFCQTCIDCVLKSQKISACYSCPECRIEFQSRPDLQKNFKLRNIVERFYEGSGKRGVPCTYCIETLEPAIKTCLMCEASLCEKHLRVHSKSPGHVLCEPTSSFDKVKCSTHGQVFTSYCHTDAAYLCVSCTIPGTHSNHQLEPLKDFCDKKKEKLKTFLEELQKGRKDTLQMLEAIRAPKARLESDFSATEKKVSLIFKEIYKQLKDLEKGIQCEIKVQCKHVVTGYTEEMDKLGKKEQDLTREIHRLEKLFDKTDPIEILQNGYLDVQSGYLDVQSGYLDVDSSGVLDAQCNNGASLKTPEKMTQENSDESRYLKTLYKGFSSILHDIKQKFPIEGETNIMLDVNTASNNVLISNDGKKASWQVNQGRPKVPERFQYHQTLSVEVFSSGLHFWDVEGSDCGNWMVGVAYPSIEREGSQSIIGKNDKSWSLCKWNNQYYTFYDKKQSPLNIKFGCRKFRICLDYEAGRLAFYDLDNLTKPVHTFTNSAFTEPLHVAVSVWESASVTILSQE